MGESEKWLEVSLAVDGELAEAVAEVLSRYAPNGVAMQTDVRDWDAEGEGIPSGPTRVYAYLPVDDKIDETRKRLEEALWYLGRIRPLPPLEISYLQETNWAESWKQHYKPILIGKRLVIVPAWLESPEPGRVAVCIEPGMAFGTGTHPSTQLCLEMLEGWFAQRSSSGKVEQAVRVIDIGCGSGILSIAAIRLGAETALGVDVDERAIQSARENAHLNGVGQHFELARGSVKDILQGVYSIQKAQLVFANILAPVIVRLFDEGLEGLVEPGGCLILSGILVEHTGDVEAAAHRRGMRVEDRRQVGDWVALSVVQELD
jgi:ribosomal protein L11 methyltransferase